jgi:hypothetical protein
MKIRTGSNITLTAIATALQYIWQLQPKRVTQVTAARRQAVRADRHSSISVFDIGVVDVGDASRRVLVCRLPGLQLVVQYGTMEAVLSLDHQEVSLGYDLAGRITAYLTRERQWHCVGATTTAFGSGRLR